MLSLTERADRRAAEVYQARIRAALEAGDTRKALHEALRHLQGEMGKMRRRRPADAALTDAHLAGSISALATALHAHKPGRPPGCPPVPSPGFLLAAFEDGLIEGGQE
jgi:hypothetical protein